MIHKFFFVDKNVDMGDNVIQQDGCKTINGFNQYNKWIDSPGTDGLLMGPDT